MEHIRAEGKMLPDKVKQLTKEHLFQLHLIPRHEPYILRRQRGGLPLRKAHVPPQ